MVTVNVSIPMNTKLNCAIRLNASYVVILPPPSIGEVVNRPPCLCSCYRDCNIFLSPSQFQQPLLQKMSQHINKNAEKETESHVTLCLYQSSTNFGAWQACYPISMKNFCKRSAAIRYAFSLSRGPIAIISILIGCPSTGR